MTSDHNLRWNRALAERLQALSVSPGCESPLRLKVASDGTSVDCELTAAGPIGCEVASITVHWNSPSVGDPRAAAHETSRRLAYLMEPIAVLEFDAPSRTALSRSHPPWREGQIRE